MKKRRKLLAFGLLMIMFLPLTVSAKELSSLKVRGIEEELSTKNNWNLTYVSPRDSMVIDAVPNNSSYVVEGVGRIALQEGTNTHTVVVKDASGTEIEKYTLNVSFTHSAVSNIGGNDDKNPNTGSFINIIPFVIGFIISIVLLLIMKKKKIYRI